uniref:Uncharacterized protein n=2 Tax=Graphocephala atropunctata TaxID=36148 RepID=A0A1B6KHA3_9HEMI
MTTDKIKGEYVYLKNHEEFKDVKLYCYPTDPSVCIMYDKYGRICGMRVAYMKEDIATRAKGNLSYKYDKIPIFKEGSAFGIPFYYIDVIFINPDLLMKGGPASRTEAVGDGAYLQLDGQTWVEMPREESKATALGFTKQACFPGMGLHYFPNMTKDLDCHNFIPVFLLYNHGKLIGMGLIPFGSFKSKGNREWFEDPPKFIINTIVPHAPTCLADWVGKYGTISFHIYFTKANAITPSCIL